MSTDILIERTDISWKAKALAIAIQLRWEEFGTPGPNKIERLVEIGMEAEVSVRSGLRELEAVGLLVRTTIREGGTLIGSKWELKL